MKPYIRPESQIILLSATQILAASIGVKDEYSSGEQFSNSKGGWNAEDWQTADEE